VNLSTRLLTGSTLLAAAALALGYGLNGELSNGLQFALFFVALGLLWLVGQRYAIRASATLGLLGFTVGALLGAWFGVESGWLLIGVTAALVAWDLHYFVQHIREGENADVEAQADEDVQTDTPPYQNARVLERAHLQRLGIVSGLGLPLGVLAMTVQLTLRFSVVLGLGLIAIFGLSRLVRYLRQEGD